MTNDLDMLAAEYVLGTLSSAERAAFEHRLSGDAEAKRAVEDWTRRLSPLAAAVEEIEPPAQLWNKIEQNLQEMRHRHAGPAAPLAANGNLAANLHRSVRRWQVAFAAATALAASLAAFVVYQGRLSVEAPQSYVAIVGKTGERPALIVNVDPVSNSAYVIPIATETPEGHSLELWFIGDGEKPKSMGLLKGQAYRFSLPTRARIEKAALAVSVEPAGGSPAGAPTGPVIYSGQLVKS
jgi:anti-sigma-K factor RskA